MVLATRGWKVLLLDKQEFPREKVCGDGLIADAENCFSRLGLLGVIDRHAYRMSRSSVFSPSRHEVEVRGE